jgi:hypothetical protein
MDRLVLAADFPRYFTRRKLYYVLDDGADKHGLNLDSIRLDRTVSRIFKETCITVLDVELGWIHIPRQFATRANLRAAAVTLENHVKMIYRGGNINAEKLLVQADKAAPDALEQ